MRSGILILLLVAVAAGLSGCMSFEQQSDWQWRQTNPNYQPLSPSARDRSPW